MELKEYLKVLSKYRITFLLIWAAVVLIGLLVASLVSQKYKATFSIDITREMQQNGTGEYDYDQFYRLEADDRFGRSLVQWFGDKAIVNQIKIVAQNTNESFEGYQFEPDFKADKLANSYLRVTFVVSEKKEVMPIFLGTKKVLEGKVAEFNGGFDAQNRFKLVFNGPTISDTKIPLTPLLIGLFGSGFFIAAFGVMFRRYLA